MAEKEYIERCADGFRYYVVRNKTTGEYFRGKGVNKWGKYYNQASIYRFRKHAENAVEEETRRGRPSEVIEIRITTADVVEVVLCKDCDLWNEWDSSGHRKLGNYVCSCAYWSCEDGRTIFTKPDDFCSYGERKEK